MPLPAIERVPGGRGFAALSRRVRTLIVAGVLFLVFFVLALVMPVPYVILGPGPTDNVLGTDPRHPGQQVIVLGGRKTNPTSGHLNMTTVSIKSGNISAFTALGAWLAGDEVVVPRTAIYPPGVSEQETNQRDAEDFQGSQDSATAAAFCELGYPKAFGVISVLDDGPAKGILRAGDALVSVAGEPADSAAELTAIVRSKQPGTSVPVVVKRKGVATTLTVRLGDPPAGQKGARLGIAVDDTCLAPFTVTIRLAGIGGPSAGLIFALGILDKVGDQDLTGGRFIAGTGEITADGEVQPIGGIQLKMIAAKRAGATVFLAPAGNCADVRKATLDGLKVIKVDTLHHAVEDLLKIQKNQAVPSC